MLGAVNNFLLLSIAIFIFSIHVLANNYVWELGACTCLLGKSLKDDMLIDLNADLGEGFAFDAQMMYAFLANRSIAAGV